VLLPADQLQGQPVIDPALIFMAVAAAVLGSLLSGCDVEAKPVSPQQYEQAKADCAPHGGLVSAEWVHVMLRPNRVDAVCQDGLRVARKD